jgi:hypothetical protein
LLQGQRVFRRFFKKYSSLSVSKIDEKYDADGSNTLQLLLRGVKSEVYKVVRALGYSTALLVYQEPSRRDVTTP